MQKLRAPTEEFIKEERTALDADATAGSNVSITVKNNDGFSENDYIVIGHEGSELAEMQQINATVTAGQTIQVANLKFNHVKGEPVTLYAYNQRKFYGATSKTGSYSELTSDGSPKTIQVDDPQGTLLEYTGNEGYTYFKATYYNSQDSTATDIGDAVAVAGDQTLRYTSLYAIRKHAGLLNNPYYSDQRLEVKRQQAESEVKSSITAIYQLPLNPVPDLIKYVTELLAAGYIDYEEFGEDGQGVKWLGEARGILSKIQKGDLILLDDDDEELPRRTDAGHLSGIPNDNTEEDRIFAIDDVY